MISPPVSPLPRLSPCGEHTMTSPSLLDLVRSPLPWRALCLNIATSCQAAFPCLPLPGFQSAGRSLAERPALLRLLRGCQGMEAGGRSRTLPGEASPPGDRRTGTLWRQGRSRQPQAWLGTQPLPSLPSLQPVPFKELHPGSGQGGAVRLFTPHSPGLAG